MGSIMRGAAAVLLALVLVWGGAAPARADRATRETPVVRVVRQAAPAVVNISSTSVHDRQVFSTGDQYLDRFFEEFFQPLQREETNLGSGVIIDGARGLIVTNSHVVSQASEIKVQLADHRVFKAQVRGADPSGDLAVLAIDPAGGLPQVTLGDSGQVMIGEEVIAIGNPFGLQHTVTTGVVSALNRRVRTGPSSWLTGLIQTDASINPGNSGGPLLNADGELIAINTAIFQRANGIGFAIPVNRVKRVVEDLIAHGAVYPVWLGLGLQDLSPELARHLGLADTRGVMITAVAENSPGARVGLKRGQVILSLDGRPLEDTGDYAARLTGLADGQEVSLGLLDNGQRRMVSAAAASYPLDQTPDLVWRRLGLAVEPLDQETARYYRLPQSAALMIGKVRRGSNAERAGLRAGDLVRQVGAKPVGDTQSFFLEVARQRLSPRIDVVFQRGRVSTSIAFGQ